MELVEEELFERGGGSDAEETHAAGLTEFAEALAKVLDGLLIGFEAVFAKGDFLGGAGFSIDEAEIAVGFGMQFFWRKYLDDVDVKAATNERVQACFVSSGIEKIAEDDGDAGLAGFDGAAAQGFVDFDGSASG